uniref:Uncharacterized protein n=1 Tax=Anguilla anguilla TaxID=7936 RepID=A0A0E9VR79_ANGAN
MVCCLHWDYPSMWSVLKNQAVIRS